jgi:hypothetical protein
MKLNLTHTCLAALASALVTNVLTGSVLAADVPPVPTGGPASMLIALAFTVLAVAAILFWIIRRKRTKG